VSFAPDREMAIKIKSAVERRAVWWALAAVCVGTLMIVADGTAVVVALPSIKVDLGFSDSSLVWVMNAYLVAYSGCLLLSGRLGDLVGHRRLFLCGITLFAAASFACVLPSSPAEFIVARGVQGLAGAIVATASISLIVNMFEDLSERAQALGIYGFACGGGSVTGVLVGGVLTSLFSWRLIFLINLPIAILVAVFCVVLLPHSIRRSTGQRLDLAGAISVTASVTIAIYAVVNVNNAGWASTETLVLLSCAAMLLMVFIGIERRTQDPLIPLGIFRARNLLTCCVASALFSAAGSAGVFVSLYLQTVLGYGPLQVGLAFRPYSMITAALSLGLSAKLVIRFGVKMPLTVGLAVAAVGVMLFVRAPVGGNVAVDVLPGLALLGLGAGVAFNPMLMSVMNGVPPIQSGLISGVISTSSTMGGALWLAVLASASATHTRKLLAAGLESTAARNGGYHVAFFIGAVSAAGAAAVAVAFLEISHDQKDLRVP
jgi:EmrB/QacA subfamily drug resistance transporter